MTNIVLLAWTFFVVVVTHHHHRGNAVWRKIHSFLSTAYSTAE